MAVYTDSNLAGVISADADFRIWGPKIAAALVAVGLVQTADTGQINWATVTKPTVGNTAAGYEIYRFNDALQATAPIFIKIEYGTGGGTTTPALWLTVGTSTNGAGTISSAIISTRKQLDGTSTNPTVQISCSGGAGWFALAIYQTAGSTSFSSFFTVDRTKDVTGADTADGCYIIASSAATSYMYHLLPFGGAALPASISAAPMIFPSSGGLSIFGLDVAMSPPILFIGKVLYGLAVLVYTNTDLQGLVSVVASVLGSNHTYLPLGVAFNTASLSGGSGSLAMRWE